MFSCPKWHATCRGVYPACYQHNSYIRTWHKLKLSSETCHFGGITIHLLCLMSISCWLLAWLILRSWVMEITCSSKQSVDFYCTIHCYIPEDWTLHSHCCEHPNLIWYELLPRIKKKLHNEELHKFYISPNVIRITKSRRMRWAGHMTQTWEKARPHAHSVLLGKPEAKRPLGWPTCKWKDNNS
jgi:hypothetical protein